jgi:hypothetical protein
LSGAERGSLGPSASEGPKDQARRGDGLVICEISSRPDDLPRSSAGPTLERSISPWSASRIPDPNTILKIKRCLDSGGQAPDLKSGLRILRLGPGIVQLSRRELPSSDETVPAQESGADVRSRRSAISAFSSASQRNLLKKMNSVDWTPLFSNVERRPAMVTLTLPGDWLSIAPTGEVFKKLLKAFRSRYERAWGEPLRGVWKLEFQRRGAPHIHIFMTPPLSLSQSRLLTMRGLVFQQWLSATWTDVISPPDDEERRKHLLAGTGIDFAKGLHASNPQRITAYFLKHSLNKSAAKAYQNSPPPEWEAVGSGPGRFWGIWNLVDVSVDISLSDADWLFVSRTLRGYVRAQQTTRRVRVARRSDRLNPLTGEMVERVRYRFVSRRVLRLRRGAGFVLFDDAPDLVGPLADWMRKGGGAT